MSIPGEVKAHEHCSLLKAAEVPEVIRTLAGEAWGVWDSVTHPQEPEGSGKFDFDYADNHQERVLVLEGEATLTPDDGGEAFTIRKGDYVVFHQGFACSWHVTVPMRKHYCYFDAEGMETQYVF